MARSRNGPSTVHGTKGEDGLPLITIDGLEAAVTNADVLAAIDRERASQGSA